MENVIHIWMGGLDDGRCPSVQQYDAKSRIYICKLWRRQHEPYQMTENAVVGVVFDWRGAPPSQLYETEIIDRSTVKVTIPTAAMQKIGPVEMQLKIFENGGELNGPVICFEVRRSLKESDKETDEPAMLLVALVAKTQELFDRGETIIQGASAAADAANEAAEHATKVAKEVEIILQPRGANQYLKTDDENNLVWDEKIFWVNATLDGTDCTVDRTLDEIVKAYNEQETVTCRLAKNGTTALMPLTKVAAGTLAAFSVMMNGLLATVTVNAGGAVYTEEGVAGSKNRALIFTGAVNTVYDGTAQRTVNIPSAGQNSQALTFTGAVNETYDGSQAVTVNIPTGGGQDLQVLTFTGAVNKTYDGSEAVTVEIPAGGQNAKTLTFTGAVNETYDGSEDVTVNIPAGGGGQDLQELIFTGAVNKTYDGSQTVTVEIPAAGQNSKTLTFTGAVNETYDGSKDVTVNIPAGGGGQNNQKLTFTGAVNEVYDGSQAVEVEIPQMPSIPKELPNPRKLKFTGAVNEEYDGSEDVTVNIPEGGGAGEDAVSMKTVTATLYANGWSGKDQTVSVPGVPADGDGNAVVVAAAPYSHDKYHECGIRCTAQVAGALTFKCVAVPDEDLAVNVMILT